MLVLLIELIVPARRQSATFDESCHTLAGYTYWTKGDFGINPEHPPLVKLLEDEHQAETRLFVRLRSLSAAALPSASARNLQGRLQHSFKVLEKSLQSHIFLETQVLFRRVF